MNLLHVLLFALLSDVEVSSQSSLRVVDDTAQEIHSPVRVCLYAGLVTECLDQPPYRIPSKLAGFTSATAEGPGHGPVAVDRSALKQDRTGAYLVRVPRKARVVLRATPGPPLSISLYRVDDPSFRKPAFRISPVTSDGVLVPAGEFLVAIADGTHAPGLSTSVLEPGSRNTVTYARLPGWSAVLRCQSSTVPVPRCVARTLSASTPSAEREIARASADRHGLVTFRGLNEPFVTVALSAPGYVPEMARGIAAKAGTFVFHATTLTRGGVVRARVTLDEQPLANARCQLLDIHGSDVGRATEVMLYDGKTTKEGLCESPRLAAGSHVLRVSPAATGNAAADELVSITEGETSEVNVRLRSIPVTGRVYRGTRRVPGAVVRIGRREDMNRRSSIYLEVDANDEGEYRGVVWTTGDYVFVAMNAARSATGAVRRVTVEEDGAEVDLHLNPHEVTGRVQDTEQRPVSDAVVLLTRDERNHRMTKSVGDGAFAFPMDAAGAIRLTSRKSGYESPEPLEFLLSADAAPAPVVLTLKKLPSVKGTVFWPFGSPAPNVGVGSFQLRPGEACTPLGAQKTDGAGAFEVPRAPAGTTQLFVTGQGCPLLVGNAPPGADELTLRCLAQSAGVQLVLRDHAGKPRSHESIILRWEGTLIPRAVLRDHLLQLGLPTETDNSGRLTLVGLPAGMYDIFLGSGASEETVSAGMQHGHLTTVQLAVFDRPEIEITVQ